MIYIIAAILIVALDQISKVLTTRYFELGEVKTIIPEILNFTYVQNEGAAFGILQGARVFFLIMTIVVFFGVLYYIIKTHPHSRLEKWALAFMAGGMNTLYQMERLPLMVAILIHGGVLYLCYLLTYLLNDWLEWGAVPIVVFSAIFVVGYMVIWAVIYSIIKRKTAKLNEMLKKKQKVDSGK